MSRKSLAVRTASSSTCLIICSTPLRRIFFRELYRPALGPGGLCSPRHRLHFSQEGLKYGW